jgi:hypothetical protein
LLITALSDKDTAVNKENFADKECETPPVKGATHIIANVPEQNHMTRWRKLI